MAGNKKKTTRKPKGKFKIELNLAKALTFGAFVVLAMVWSFILGVFVGRGYNPEDVIPDIARVMPDARQEIPASRILRPEDLDFFDRLRSASPSEQKISAPAREQTAKLTGPDPVIKVQPDPPADPVIKAQPDPPAAPVPIPDTETFIYSYQVGSFQTLNRAAALQKQLAADGISASIADAFIENEPWYRVIVEFESSAPDKVIKKLETHGITQPVFRGKRPS